MKLLRQLFRRLRHSKSMNREVCLWTSVGGGLEGLTEEMRRLFSQPDGLKVLNEIKARRQPVIDADYVRALHFWKLGQLSAVKESLKEELRYFPYNQRALRLQHRLFEEDARGGAVSADPQWQQLKQAVLPYTMMGELRLENIYVQTSRLCREAVPGHFVECGVAAGGSSALLAAVIKKNASQNRRVFAFDTFDGMPDPTKEDTHQGSHANDTGWGAGTCSASEQSLLEICGKLGVTEFVTSVKGLFCDTLPHRVREIGPVAFLHVDGDWYSSTLDVLDNLFDSVVPGGVIQFDDYGYWDGCRQAVHEFMERRKLAPVLQKIDSTGVWMIKS